MNQKNSEVEFKNLQDDVINNLFFDNLSISKSKLFIVNDTIQHKIDINNLNIIQIQKNTNGINFDISIFEGNIDNYSIDQFSGKFKLNDDKVVFENFLLSNENQYLEGDLDLYLNDDFSIKNFNDSYIKFKVDSDILNIDNNFFPKFISGELSFLGSKNNLSIEKALFFSDFFNVDSKIVIENGLSSNPIVKIDLKNLDFNKDKINTEYKIDDRINYPSVSGDLTLNDNIITYKFNQVDKTKTNLSIDGIAKLDDTLSYSFTLNSSIASEDKILDILNLNSLKINSNISGTKDQFFSMESSIFIIKDDKDFTLDINSLINNNDLNAKVDLSSENIKIFSNISGNNLNKTYKINSDMDLIIPDAQSLSFQTKAIIDVDFSELEYIKSLVSLQNIYLKNSENEIHLESFAEINNLLDANFIENITNYDFGIIYSNDKFSINSYLGDRFNFSGYYKNENDLDFNIQISDLYVSNFYKINQNPISGNIISNIGFNRTLENRTLEFNSNISDIKLKDYDLGELNLKVFGNTDYNSYAVDLDLSDKSNNQIKGEGTIIAINEKPNIDIDLLINNFDISFIERIGLKTMSEISSNVSGEVNLWGAYDNIQHNGKLFLNKSSFIVPYLNVEYLLSDKSEITLYNQNFELNNVSIKTIDSESITSLNGKIFHEDYKNWNLDLAFNSDRLYIINKEFSENENFYGKAFIGGDILINGPTNNVRINIDGITMDGTSIIIPNSQNYSVEEFSFIKFSDINSYSNVDSKSKNQVLKTVKTLDLNMNLEINNSADIEITIDRETGSYISGNGNGNLFMEIDSDGKFNMFGDFTTKEGIYNFRNLALIDKKFQLKEGGSIIWDGEPLGAQMNIQATYNVPGGANPALLLDNPNFNKKIPTDVEINLTGDLTKPDSPDFEIFFPNTSSTVTSEINYKLNDPEIRQLQAISLLTQGIFINEVSVSIEGVTNNIYEKVSEVFSDILGGSQGPLEVGLNYLQGDKSDILDIKTEDRFGVTLSTKISDKILFNGKIGVPIGGIEETLIIGDVQIDFILNEDGSLKAKVFNKENEFRYIGDELGYTQGVGLSYQVDFQTFRDLLSKIIANNN
ncbi:MAG: translocation/assembly module TamB [Flavobacteriales bacterium]|nr:translocation/assembly module TamB [Flavobacteriales bacterium]MBL6876602.1 translocation/assembly module TamB [Flavobacteriales bacterium]